MNRTRAQIAQDTIDLGFSRTGIAMQQIARELDSIHRETFSRQDVYNIGVEGRDGNRVDCLMNFTPAEDAEPID